MTMKTSKVRETEFNDELDSVLIENLEFKDGYIVMKDTDVSVDIKPVWANENTLGFFVIVDREILYLVDSVELVDGQMFAICKVYEKDETLPLHKIKLEVLPVLMKVRVNEIR